MASKKRQMKKPYVIWRTDGTYKVYDLYARDVDALELAWMNQLPFAKLSIGLIGLSDIREVLEWIEPEAPKAPTREEFIASLPADLSVEERQWMIENVARYYDDPVERGEFV